MWSRLREGMTNITSVVVSPYRTQPVEIIWKKSKNNTKNP